MTNYPELEETALQQVYEWVDEVPLSRPKRNIARDFADGLLIAEVINYFFPKLVDMHNYSSASSLSQKKGNWNTLNTKVFKRLGTAIPQDLIEAVVAAKPPEQSAIPYAIERVLLEIKTKVEFYRNKQLSERQPSGFQGENAEPEYVAPTRKNQAPYNESNQPYATARGNTNKNVVQQQPAAQSSNNQSPQGSNGKQPSAMERWERHQQEYPESALNYSYGPPTKTGPQRPNQPPAPAKPPINAAASSAGSNNSGAGRSISPAKQRPQQIKQQVDTELLIERDQVIEEQRATIAILEEKVAKYEQLLRLKDAKIEKLESRLGKK